MGQCTTKYDSSLIIGHWIGLYIIGCDSQHKVTIFFLNTYVNVIFAILQHKTQYCIHQKE